METDNSMKDCVAPLQIRKQQKDGLAIAMSDDLAVRALELQSSTRTKFQNFLRASYPFQSTSTPSPSTVTLGLSAGDIILVHSVHSNGWADGTLLETGERGWLPTNYCESYDYGTMRPLLKALTEFWDIIRCGDELNAALFHNHDYMRGIVAGVRFLLEKSDCLTRESRWVKKYDTVRRIRKALLADLSNLVKAAKGMQQIALSNVAINEVADFLDDMLLKAFRVVIQAVNFFDIWTEEIASRDPSMLPSSSPIPGLSKSAVNVNPFPTSHIVQQSTLLDYHEDTNSIKRPASYSSRRQTLTHRMSHSGRPARGMDNLASDKLNSTYDAFLGVLASFLGSHMQSRSSSELLLTTQMAVKACSNLLRVVETVIDHKPSHAKILHEAKDNMCDRITELVDVTKQVFRPLESMEEDMLYLPSEGIQLVNAATACVSGAGLCVSKARLVLEECGDFELDIAQSTLSNPIDGHGSHASDGTRPQSENLSTSEVQSIQKPLLAVSTLNIPRAVQESDTTTSETIPFWTPTGRSNQSPISNGSSLSPHATVQPPPHNQPYLRNIVNITGSETTLISSVRDSGPSVLSDASTRAGSPDRGLRKLPVSPKIDNFIPFENEELSDGENELMELTFAHELLVNGENRVIGGSLNAIVERLTAHDSTPDCFLVSTVYLTFRLFTSPLELAKALAYRFEYIARSPRIAGPVRLRVYNLLKGWLEAHWRDDCDAPALPFITEFAQTKILAAVPSAGQRLIELTKSISEQHAPATSRILSSIGKTTTARYMNNDQPLPTPAISKTQLAILKSWKAGATGTTVVDFDPFEIARQITIRESTIFCSILPAELLCTEFTKQSSSLSVNVRAMAQLSNDLANFVADSVLQLDEAKKRAAVIKHWIKVAKKCLELNNYDTLMAVVCSINSSTILRLRRTWELINQKTKNLFDELKKVVDVSKNYSNLRHRIAAHTPPCLPFVGMYLTDLTFVDHGNPSTRQLKTGDEEISVVNLDKHMKTAKIISDLQRFQIPYRLTEVPDLQTWLQDELIRVRAAGERNFQNHYRRSLILEPRETASRPTTMSTLGSVAPVPSHKDRFDFLSWTQFGRDKTMSIGL